MVLAFPCFNTIRPNYERIKIFLVGSFNLSPLFLQPRKKGFRVKSCDCTIQPVPRIASVLSPLCRFRVIQHAPTSTTTQTPHASMYPMWTESVIPQPNSNREAAWTQKATAFFCSLVEILKPPHPHKEQIIVMSNKRWLGAVGLFYASIYK